LSAYKQIQIAVLWIMKSCSFARIPTFRRTFLPPSSLHPEDGGRKVDRNDSILPQHYTASQTWKTVVKAS